MRAVCLLLAGAGALAGCSSTAGQCESGTVRHGDTCYRTDPTDDVPPVITVDPPLRTRALGTVRLTSNEPATIYYTTDGTTPTQASRNERDLVELPNLPNNALVEYFGIDLNGNQSPVQIAVWQIDNIGPGAPQSFQLAVSGATRTLTWTPPPDKTFRGVLLARIEGTFAASPMPGKIYAVGDSIGPGATVVAVMGTAPFTFSESHTSGLGITRYAAWSFDDIGNYGSPAVAYAVDPLGMQLGTVKIDTSTNAVTIDKQPANFQLAGTAALNGSTLTLDLTVTNGTTRTVFAPKLLLTNTLPTQSFDNSDGSLATFPYRAYGAAIPPGDTIKKTWQIGNVNVGDQIELDLDIRDGHVLFGGHWTQASAGSTADEDTQTFISSLSAGVRTLGNNGAGNHGAVITADGRVLAGARNSSELGLYDLSTGQRLLGNVLLAGKSSVAKLVLDPSGGTGYAVAQLGHSYGTTRDSGNRGGAAGIQSYLVRFDAATLQETGRLDIGTVRSRDLAISPDGSKLAIASGLQTAGVLLVDLGTFAGVTTIATDTRPDGVTWSPDGKSLLVASLTRLDVYAPDGTLTASHQLTTNSSKAFHPTFGPDGRLWMSRKSDVAAIDLATGVQTYYSFSSAILAVAGDKLYVGDEGSSSFTRIDATGTSDVSVNFQNSVYGHGLARSPF